MRQLTLNKIALLCFALTIFISCEKRNYTKHTRHIEISKKIDADMVCVVSSIEDKESISLYGNKQGTLKIVRERFKKGSFSDDEIHSNFFMSIYNLTDTTSFLQKNATNEDARIFYKHFDLYDVDYEDTKVNHFYDAYTLTIDSTLLPIFKKDYGMLEQFSEYYE